MREKAKELWQELFRLEEEKYDFEQRINRQKYDVSFEQINLNSTEFKKIVFQCNQLRQRVNEYMGKFSKNKNKVKIAGRGVGHAAAAFK